MDAVDGGDTDTRERIVREAAQLFAARGYAATSIRDIGSAVGVSSAALYHHFSTKDAILVELATRANRLIVGMVEQASALPDPERGEALLAGFLDTFAAHGRTFLPLLNDPSCLRIPQVADKLLAGRAAFLDAFELTMTGPDRRLRAAMVLSALRG
ncbi:MAG: TetR/AcrR family transcriptional regulator, partial [Nocardioides sp.]